MSYVDAMSRVTGAGILVTGASSGIGWALSRRLGAAGARLVVSARRAARLEQLADLVEGDGGVRPVIVPADLGQRGEAGRLGRSALDALGQVDILVNNAG